MNKTKHSWCRHHREFTVRVDDESLVLFRNDRIGRKLPTDARRFFLDALVSAGAARWMDDGAARKSRALIFWQSLGVWVTVLSDWAARNGLEGQVVALCEITGDDEVGVPTPDGFRDAPVEFVALVALELEKKGKGVFVPSDAGRDAGVKFF
jgi:DNA-binding transcriptional LysR family regulator|tara:strand:- start:131 stop:586 length:456 start_codon:yes stop_codon:yes gene_type:complete